MAKESIASLTGRLFELLEPLSPEDRAKVVNATFVLLGDSGPSGTPTQPGAGSPQAPGEGGKPRAQLNPGAGNAGSAVDAKTYIDRKDPRSKVELLAVAARYLEEHDGRESVSKDDLKRVFDAARRNFDSAHFARDMNNAKGQAGFFNTGGERNEYKLSYYGHNFIDALPDREKASAIRRPKRTGAKKKASRKKG